jgi:hypothetical protein
MLENGFKAGSPPYSPEGFNAWHHQDADIVIQKIRQDWTLLGRDPDLADIVWFLPPSLSN